MPGPQPGGAVAEDAANDGTAAAAGRGEIKPREYTRGTEKNRQTYYDADVY